MRCGASKLVGGEYRRTNEIKSKREIGYVSHGKKERKERQGEEREAEYKGGQRSDDASDGSYLLAAG